jgi:transposase
MNWDNFSKWFETQLLPNIPANSLIIMDNAAYHNVLVEDVFPKRSHSITRLQEWLTNNKTPWSTDMLKSELYELCAEHAPKPEFRLDQIASKFGHSILRTPPYHPELQPIETCWGVVKNHVAQHNDCKRTHTGMKTVASA